MKKTAFVLYLLSALLLCSCEHTVEDLFSAADNQISQDFKTRFPDANINYTSHWNDGTDNIHFTDADGINGIAIYLNGTWIKWVDTRYPLNLNTPLPSSVLIDKEQFETRNPGKEFSALFFMDCPEGQFYRLTFGSELENTTIYSIAD